MNESTPNKPSLFSFHLSTLLVAVLMIAAFIGVNMIHLPYNTSDPNIEFYGMGFPYEYFKGTAEVGAWNGQLLTMDAIIAFAVTMFFASIWGWRERNGPLGMRRQFGISESIQVLKNHGKRDD